MIDEHFNIPVNEFQTPITAELLNEYPEEVQEWFMDFITNIEFIKNLISPNRKRAKDLPRDNQGRIIIDFANPHIIEDADYFRQPALHFLKHGCYTLLKPNGNPQSEYRKFWEEERRRIREGYVRESDGEWVTGYMYWFLNYTPMMVNAVREGTLTADRIESFPFFFEGIYWRFHYLNQAKITGTHAIELAKRGCGKSFSLASIMTHNLFHGESSVAKKRITTVITAYEKEYLKDDKDGTLAKFIPIMDFVRSNTPFPRLLLKNSPNEMSWIMGYKDATGATQGSRNTVLGVSAKDNPDKLRGKRGWILFEEMGTFRGLLALYDTTRKSVEDGKYAFACMYLVGCVCAGTKIWTSKGENILIENLTKEQGIIGFTDTIDIEYHNELIHLERGVTNEPILSNIFISSKPCVEIELCNGNILRCSTDHPILVQKHRMNHDGSVDYYEEVFKNAGDLKIKDRVLECREVYIFGNDTLFDARLVGMLIGDGSYGSSIKYCSEDSELLNYVKSNYEFKIYKNHITKKNKIYEEGRINGIRGLLNKIGILGQTKQNKRLTNNYQTLCEKDIKLLLSGLYDTDGTFTLRKDGYAELTQSNKEILEQVKLLWRKFGVLCSIREVKPNIKEGRKDKNPWYNLSISGRYNILRVAQVLDLLVLHKKEKLNEIIKYYLDNPSKKEQKYPKDIIVSKVKSIKQIGIQKVYNLTAGLSHTYLANNIITHNTANEKESSFESAKILLYNTKGYRLYSLKNVYDKKNHGRPTFGYFFPAYINRAGCYNKDGVSDVVKALLEILMARYTAKYGEDPTSVLRVIAEDPITPAEAIIKVKNAYFPTQALSERLAQLDSNPNAFDDVYVGGLVLKNGEVEFEITGDTPIRQYQKDGAENITKGAVEIFEMPAKDKNGKVYYDRYIIGHDPVDNDQAESSSLSSTIVLDLWTDRIVAEYTGRQLFADENYEIVRLLCIFYNAKCLFESNKKGIYQYFQKMYSTHLLLETPQYLRDRQLVKYNNFGSNQYGVNATAAINNYANSLIRDWLLLPKPTIIKKEDGSELETTVPNLYNIKNRALIEELIAFAPEINVDRVRALGMVMLAREEKMVLWGGTVKKSEQKETQWDKDPFFKDNYEDKFGNEQFDLFSEQKDF